MNIHEYQGKSILKSFGVAVPAGYVINKVEDAREAALKVQKESGADTWAIKAQIHAGGSGKGGGVKIARSLDEVEKYARDILGMTLITKQTSSEGKVVHSLLIEQGIYYEGPEDIREFYMGVLLNRYSGRNMIMYSSEGGMDIEEVAEKTPHLIYREEIDPAVGLQGFQARRIAFNLGLSGLSYKEMLKFVSALYQAYEKSDSAMFEINPVLKAADGKIYAADAKVSLDDNALFRNSDYAAMRDLNEEEALEIKAKDNNLNYIKLDGNVGCMVNGAGLAMATMDMIKLAGGAPANFLDVGGGANAQTVEAGFRIILDDENVKAILINIFGGIVRCDRVAAGVIEAYKNIGNITLPIIVRLQGTNAEEAKKMIDESGLQVFSAIHLEDAAQLISKVMQN
jgi:succinyl-CoA synthetase beta subunit